MRWPAPASFRSQAFIIGAAALAVFALAALIIRDAVFATEERLLGDARQRCTVACLEILRQYQERINYTDDPLHELPPDAQDVSFKGITSTVLLAYPEIKGGMFLPSEGRITGYSFPDAPETAVADTETEVIQLLAEQVEATGETVTYSSWRGNDLIAGAAAASDEIVVWTLYRAPEWRYPLIGANNWLLVALVFSSLLGVGGIISIWYRLHSGVREIQKGLHLLETDFSFRLPAVPGDLGQVALDINGMAERRMALEEKLRQQDRLAALGKVVSGVAHEVRNPLNSIKLTLQLLERRLKKGIAVSNEVPECLEEIDRLDAIVGRLLAFGRPTMVNRHAQEITPVITQAIRMVQDPACKKNIRIETRFSEKKPSADIDGQQIVQVLINLLLNAIEASADTGTVIIRINDSSPYVSISITDEGARIADDIRPHIFDAYYTTKPEGNGLGLAVSREIAMNHGGRLEFESEAAGTTFTLLLPMERTSADAA
jgi:signal transduction histidine kinase